MLTFATPEGADILANLRFDRSAVPAPGGSAPIVMLAAAPSEECGCPEELWSIHGVLTLIHFEADGVCEGFFMGDGWETEERFEAADMPALRAEAFRWVENLPSDDDA